MPVALPRDTVEWYKNRETGVDLAYLIHLVARRFEGKRVLDLGCAGGDYLALFPKGSVGLEASAPSLEACRRKGLDARYGDLNRPLEFSDCEFDVVFCSHVLEHVDSPVNLLREAWRVLRPDGMVLIAVPNEDSLANRIGRDPYFGGHFEHLYSFSKDNLLALFSRTGFEVETVLHGVYSMNRLFASSPALAKALQNAYQLVGHRFLPYLTSQHWVVGRKLGAVGGAPM
jgi:SAM-dependent methyltransferase